MNLAVFDRKNNGGSGEISLLIEKMKKYGTDLDLNFHAN